LKKILLAASVVLVGSTVAPATSSPIEAEAKVDKYGDTWYDMKPNFATSLKKGTMPYAKGKIGMTYKELSKKAPKDNMYFFNGLVYYSHEREKQDFDDYIFEKGNFNSKSKVKMMHRSYNYLISEKSIRTYFGKPIKKKSLGGNYGRYMYKSRRYYMNVTIYSESGYSATIFNLGTKDVIKKDFDN